MPLEEWLDLLIEHEIAYAGMAASCERTAHALYLHAPDLPDYHDANRALRLRTAGSSAEAVVRQVISYFRARGLTPVADLDPIAKAEGIGAALLLQGMTPVSGDRLLMRYGSATPPPMRESSVTIDAVANETGAGEATEWIDTAVADDIGWPDEALWRAVAAKEARYTACRLYIARLDGLPVGACDLFGHAEWGRIESVVTRPEARRQGVGAALVSRAIRDSLTSGNRRTYLFTEPGGAAERLYRRLGFVPWHTNVLLQYRG